MNELHRTVQWYVDKKLVLEVSHTGSREICSPAPTDTDDDYILLCEPEYLKELEIQLTKNKWVRGGSMHNDLSDSPYEGAEVDRTSVFSSWKKQDGWNESKLNFIVTISPEFYQNFVLATRLAKKLNLLKKEDRVTLFNSIVYNEFPEV